LIIPRDEENQGKHNSSISSAEFPFLTAHTTNVTSIYGSINEYVDIVAPASDRSKLT
jgi:hypothetical protein